MSFKEKFFKVGRFLRVIDEDNLVSLTNVSLMLVLTKFMVTPSVSIAEIGAIFLGVLNYMYKRHISSKKPTPEQVNEQQETKINQLTEQFKEIKDQVGKLGVALTIRPRK